MKNILILILLSTPIFLMGQLTPELIVNDTDNDGDVLIEMQTNDNQSASFRNLTLGLNQSSQGWLRTLTNGSNQTNNHLSFWTNNLRRLSIIDADLGINTTSPQEKIHLRSGNALLTLKKTNQNLYESKVKFHEGSTLSSSLSYSLRTNSSVRPSLNISHPGFGKIELVNQVTAVSVFLLGTVRLNQLSGSGDRNLVANSSANLTTQALPQSYKLNITPSHFRQDNTFNDLGPGQISPEIVTGRVGAVRMAAPINLPEGSRITSMVINYIDFDPFRNVKVNLIRSQNDQATAIDNWLIFTSNNISNNTNPVLTTTVSTGGGGWVIKDPRDHASVVQIDMEQSNNNNLTGISSITLNYELP